MYRDTTSQTVLVNTVAHVALFMYERLADSVSFFFAVRCPETHNLLRRTLVESVTLHLVTLVRKIVNSDY
jgi:hypothetical protein